MTITMMRLLFMISMLLLMMIDMSFGHQIIYQFTIYYIYLMQQQFNQANDQHKYTNE